MAGDESQLLDGAPEHGGCTPGHVAVRGAVEAIAAHPTLGVQLVRKGVEVGPPGQGLVKGGVEDGHLGHRGQHLACDADAQQVGRVVQRGELDMVFDGGLDLWGDDHRPGEGFAPVHHAVAHSADLAQVGEGRALPLGEGFEDQPQADGVVLYNPLYRHRHRPDAPRQPATRLTDALDHTAGQHPLIRHVEQLELDGRAARVDDQNLHGLPPRARERAMVMMIAGPASEGGPTAHPNTCWDPHLDQRLCRSSNQEPP